MKAFTTLRSLNGATLIKSLVVLSILSLLLHIALFEYKPLLAKNRLESNMQTVKRALQFTRLKAQTNDAYVTFCALKHNRCNKAIWHKSLTIFVDRGVLGVFESGDTKLMEIEAISKFDMLTYQRHAVTFSPAGMPMGLGNGTFIYCPEYSKASLKGLALSVSPIGRVRLIDTDKCQTDN
ncbi:GspH/FimT family protein [Pseudoalteromonas shioyasakiensis]|uniref:GspH/FimT family protein n=1 Tax=Pseudoalteromonas shioyasakiensis TaxID=1190813 RepID=UPI0022B18477|nr:GspH/FimT family protein [Pseudoalteromonas shioyasakiensis]MCZ4250753.1 GspH/FimT family protein [Pseudoalteromonas shioyasakiensis]